MINLNEHLLTELASDELYLFLHISKRINKDKTCFPSNELLQKETNFGIGKVKRLLNVLKEKGMIAKIQPKNKKGQFAKRLLKVISPSIGVFNKAKNNNLHNKSYGKSNKLDESKQQQIVFEKRIDEGAVGEKAISNNSIGENIAIDTSIINITANPNQVKNHQTESVPTEKEPLSITHESIINLKEEEEKASPDFKVKNDCLKSGSFQYFSQKCQALKEELGIDKDLDLKKLKTVWNERVSITEEFVRNGMKRFGFKYFSPSPNKNAEGVRSKTGIPDTGLSKTNAPNTNHLPCNQSRLSYETFIQQRSGEVIHKRINELKVETQEKTIGLFNAYFEAVQEVALSSGAFKSFRHFENTLYKSFDNLLNKLGDKINIGVLNKTLRVARSRKEVYVDRAF